MLRERKLLQKNDTVSETEQVKPAAKDPDNPSFTAADEQLDTLPDLEDTVMFEDEGSSSSYRDGDINNDSDFATGGVRRKSVEPPEVKDAELMAKAISSILTGES